MWFKSIAFAEKIINIQSAMEYKCMYMKLNVHEFQTKGDLGECLKTDYEMKHLARNLINQ
jgi:hypothetical protein